MEVAPERRIERDPLHLALEGDELARIEDDRHVARRVGLPLEEEAHLDLRWGVADPHAEEESVELRLGEREGPGEVLRVLRGDDEEGVGQRNGLPIERHLPLVHALEQRRLRARARAVDLVGEENVREDRALPEDELARPLIIDRDAHDVARQQIARELHAPQIPSDGARERARERRLADARDVLDEQVPSAEQRDERELHGLFLSLESAFDRVAQASGWDRKLFGGRVEPQRSLHRVARSSPPDQRRRRGCFRQGRRAGVVRRRHRTKKYGSSAFLAIACPRRKPPRAWGAGGWAGGDSWYGENDDGG